MTLIGDYLLLLPDVFHNSLIGPLLTGTVTKKNVSGQLRVYPYDRRLFHPGATCPTCQLPKPARSKHCSEDRCSFLVVTDNQHHIFDLSLL